MWLKAVIAVSILSAAETCLAMPALEIDTQSAHAVLDALADPKLSQEAAHRIAALPANQQMIRKALSFSPAATQQAFESELLAVAQCTAPASNFFYFDRVKQNLPEVRATLAEFEANRDPNVTWVLDRLSRFTPEGAAMQLKGWIIAGGGSTGFAFGDPEFYLRITDFVGSPSGLKAVMAHELFHAAQESARTKAGVDELDPAKWAQIKTKDQRDAYAVRYILTQLLKEGLASFVGDPEFIATGDSKLAIQERLRMSAGNRPKIATLLDMALMSVTSSSPLDPERVYAVGFLGPDQPLYYLGYRMAKAIAEKEGAERIRELAVKDGCAFAQDYVSLTREHAELLKLGTASTTIIARSCPKAAS